MTEVSLHRYPKRRRLERSSRKCNGDTKFWCKGMKINELPQDALHAIFHWLPCGFLVKNLKRVSKYFQEHVNEYLHNTFLKLCPRLSRLQSKTRNTLDAGRSTNRCKNMFLVYKYCDPFIQEYRILEAAILRYLLQRNSEFVYCYCFGRILDIFDDIYFQLYNHERLTSSAKIDKSSKKLHTIIRSFISHFERHTEESFNTNCFVSGAKICDILETGTFYLKKILDEKYDNDLCYLKIRYTLPNAWFIVLPTDSLSQEQKSWSEQQRVMYTRLRRLISSHTYQEMNLHHWKNAKKFINLGIRDQPIMRNYVYNGYGEFDGELFFYGNFNIGGYTYKVRKLEHREPSEDEIIPYNVQIDLELTCSLQQAPLFVYKKHFLSVDRMVDRLTLRRKSPRLNSSTFRLKTEFVSVPPLNRFLSPKYVFEVSEEKRLEILEKQAKSCLV